MLVKGKPPERAGRKTAGLSLERALDMAAGLPGKILRFVFLRENYSQAVRKVLCVVFIISMACMFPMTSSAIPRKLSDEELSSIMVQMASYGSDKLVYIRNAGKNKHYYKYDGNIYFPAEVEEDPDIEAASSHFFINEAGLRCVYNPITGQTISCENAVLTYETVSSSYRVCGRGPGENLGIFMGSADVGCINVDYSSRQLNFPQQGKIIAQEVEPQYPPKPIGQYALRMQTIDVETNIDSFSALIRYGNDDLGVLYVQGIHAQMNSDIIIETYYEPTKYFGFFLGWQKTK